MATENKRTTLRQVFEKLPGKVRAWLTSEETTSIIIELNNKLGLDGVLIDVIPRAITKLVTRSLPPEKFAEELSNGLGIESPTANNLTQEIERRILRPVEVLLRNEVGVDIKMIYAGIQTTQPKPTPPVVPSAPLIYRPAPQTPPIVSAPPSVPIPPKPPTPPAPQEMPVKINVQKPRPDQPFGPDSWVNKVK